MTGNLQGNTNVCIKWANGLMIYQTKIEVSVNFSSTMVGQMYRQSLYDVAIFPTEFKSLPTVSITTANDEDYIFCFVYAVRRTKKKITNVDLLRPTTGSGSATLQIMAIGFWK